ncbi:hypothetical protein F5Y08DRAFT_124497 [Xylaria arbuscula]|nr:hypothetical protein F5Y08DRAFT_124497 [Xylaria arbuscula]
MKDYRIEWAATIGVLAGIAVGSIALSRQRRSRLGETFLSPPAGPHTFRLTNVSSKATLPLLCQELLGKQSSDLQHNLNSSESAEVLGASLTGSVTAQEMYKSQVATVCVTQIPQQLRIHEDGYIDEQVQFYFENDIQQYRIDNHFFGMTPLYWHADWVIDIVAVTGWNARAFGSWKPQHAQEMWLRDWLGQDLAEHNCPARVLTYGYSSKVANTTSDASLRDYGSELLRSLRDTSLGGLLIKQALKLASSSDDQFEQDIYRSCVGLFMFGVPNKGLENQALLDMTNGQKNETFTRDLGVNSQYLPELERDFSAAVRRQAISVIAI